MVKPGPEHHGTWFFIRNQLDELRQLNPNTFFSVCEMNDNYTDTQSSGCFIYGDCKNIFFVSCLVHNFLLLALFSTSVNDTQHEVKSDNMRPEDWEEVILSYSAWCIGYNVYLCNRSSRKRSVWVPL